MIDSLSTKVAPHFGSGDATFDCHITARRVMVDLGGAIATEDARGDTWTTADGQELLFTRSNLERICDDVLRFFPSAAPAALDGRPLGGTQVSTPAFPVVVRRTAPAPYWQDSVDLGHPGLLFASYCGWKADVPLGRGTHTIEVDLTGGAGAPTHFRYDITVGWVRRAAARNCSLGRSSRHASDLVVEGDDEVVSTVLHVA